MTTRSGLTARSVGRRLGGIDLLRFVAALMVVVYHLSFIEWLSPHSLGSQLFKRQAPVPWLVDWAWCGWIGVQVFFVISGFVISFSSTGVSPRSFVRGRVCRLWPAVFVVSTLSLTLYFQYSLFAPSVVMQRYLKEITFVPVGPWLNGVVWTLGVEIVFYALVFVMLRLNLARRIHRLAAALALWSFAYHVILWLPDQTPLWPLQAAKWGLTRFPRASELLLLNHGAFFALGIVLFLYFRRRFGVREAVTALVALGACVMQVARTYVWETMEYRSFDVPVDASILLPLTVWAVALLLMWAVVSQARDGRDLFAGLPSLAALGQMTYPLYLAHTWVGLSVILALRGWALPAPVEVAAAVLASVGVAWAVNRFLEPAVRRFVGETFDSLVPERASRSASPLRAP